MRVPPAAQRTNHEETDTMMTTKDHTTVWVCTDCMMTEASGEELDTTDREPWSKLGAGEVTPGVVASEHHEDCPNIDHEGGWIGSGDCPGCETQDFSWSRCDGCGSTLGGERHAYTYWCDAEAGNVSAAYLLAVLLALLPGTLVAWVLASLAGGLAGVA